MGNVEERLARLELHVRELEVQARATWLDRWLDRVYDRLRRAHADTDRHRFGLPPIEVDGRVARALDGQAEAIKEAVVDELTSALRESRARSVADAGTPLGGHYARPASPSPSP